MSPISKPSLKTVVENPRSVKAMQGQLDRMNEADRPVSGQKPTLRHPPKPKA